MNIEGLKQMSVACGRQVWCWADKDGGEHYALFARLNDGDKFLFRVVGWEVFKN